jgi:hypothetical protein
VIAFVPPVWASEPPPTSVAWVTEVRAPLVALEIEDARRARRSSDRLFTVAASEMVVGGAALAGWMSQEVFWPGATELPPDPSVVFPEGFTGRAAGSTLVAFGAFHGFQAVVQRQMAARRHAAFRELTIGLPDRDDAWSAAAVALRQRLEREARGHAFASGAYGAVTGIGLVATVAGLEIDEPALVTSGFALASFGGIGWTHHTTRWRATVRLSVDAESVLHRVPTVLP